MATLQELDRNALLDEWADALESGEYNQTQGYLKYTESEEIGTGYCCLGVLCDVLANKGIGEWSTAPGADRVGNFMLDNEHQTAFLPEAIANKISMTQAGKVKGSQNSLELTRANDDEGRSFAYIAKVIRGRKTNE